MLSAIHQEFEPSEELQDSIKCFWYRCHPWIVFDLSLLSHFIKI